MVIAVGATLCLATTDRLELGYFAYLAPALVISAGIGWMMAARVAMTAMPELVALLHSFVGLAAGLGRFCRYFDQSGSWSRQCLSLGSFHRHLHWGPLPSQVR